MRGAVKLRVRRAQARVKGSFEGMLTRTKAVATNG
jgi:hypothetical protein